MKYPQAVDFGASWKLKDWFASISISVIPAVWNRVSNTDREASNTRNTVPKSNEIILFPLNKIE